MSRSNKNELMQIIETQKEEIEKYKSKIRDVVQAYKSLSKEKEALESSVKILTYNDGVNKLPSNDDKSEKTNNQTKLENEITEIETLKKKISTLTLSLNTIMEEKNKMNANYQSEKKLFKKEYDDLKSNFEQQIFDCNSQLKLCSEKSQEWKSQLIVEQHEREQEHSNYAMQLKELQILLSEERKYREITEMALSEAKHISSSDNLDISQYEKKVAELSKELNIVRNRLTTTEDSASKPSPLLLNIEKEMSDLKRHHQLAILAEQRKTEQAEKRAGIIAEQNEQRVASLESRLSELSDIVGKYETDRSIDKKNISKLKERLNELDSENNSLAKVAGVTSINFNSDESLLNSGTETIIEKMLHLKDLLKAAHERSSTKSAINFSNLLTKVFRNCDSDNYEVHENIHKRCLKEYDSLKEEFERYKLKAQSILKNKLHDTKGSHTLHDNQEMEKLRRQLADEQNRVRTLRNSIETQKEEHSKIIEELRKSLSVQAETRKLEKLRIEAENGQKLFELEGEIKRHRDRTISLLAEKEREIDSYKQIIGQRTVANQFNIVKSDNDGFEYVRGVKPVENQSLENLDKSENDVEYNLTELITKNGDKQLLHFTNEHARRNVDLLNLRKLKETYELENRRLQHEGAYERQQFLDQINFLKTELRRIEKNKSRESANLEYLKNVVYQYMIINNLEARERMLKAISTILEFSKEEKDNVLKHLQNHW